MPAWLSSALDYIPEWLAFQMRASERPGCVAAIAHRGRVVLERAWGTADLATGETLTPRHRFRVASHSKSYTAAGILKLREQGKLKLDDRWASSSTGCTRRLRAPPLRSCSPIAQA
jgi:CubicO group peptidase (beta-lactamase class C family)